MENNIEKITSNYKIQTYNSPSTPISQQKTFTFSNPVTNRVKVVMIAFLMLIHLKSRFFENKLSKHNMIN